MAVEVDLVEHLGDLLASGDTKSVKALIEEESFAQEFVEKTSELIHIASFHLNKETIQEKPYVAKYSVEVLLKCAEKGNAKECLMEFLAQLESLDEVKFQFLLKPVQIVLLRIPEKKAPLMICLFNAIYLFINSLQVPKFHHLDKDSKLLMDCDEKFMKIRDNYQLIIAFYEPFVDEVSKECTLDKRIKNLKLALTQALLQLLGFPVIFLDLEEHEKGSSTMRVLVAKIVTLLLKLQNDPISFLALVQSKEVITLEEEKLIVKEFSSNDFKFSAVSLSAFFYLIFCENLCLSVPQVYNTLFIFENCLALAVPILKYKESLVLRKGLLLCEEAMGKVERGSVPFSHLESTTHKEIIDCLSNIVMYNEMEENRKLAAELIKNHFLVFEPKAQFYILYNSGISEHHANVIGYFTTFLTNSVRESFSNPLLKEYFTGKRLFDLMSVFCFLKKGAETDLLENRDQIVSVLNLIIFLTRRDRENTCGIWDYVPQLVKHFLNPLREGVKLSKAHYELQLKTLGESQEPKDEAEFSVNVGDETLGRMSVDEKKSVLESSLTSFALIEHLLIRAEECVEDKPEQLLHHKIS